MHYIVYVTEYLFLIILYTVLYKIIYKKQGFFSFTSKLFLCAIIVILSGIRCNFGSDYYVYFRLYNVIADPINISGGVQRYIEQNVQVGFPLLMHIVREFTSSPYAIFMVCACIIYPLIFHWIDKRTTNKAYSILLFFLFGLFDITNNILKQSIAMCILLYALDAIIEKKYIKFGLLAVLAVLFHVSSLVVIIIMVVSCIVELKKRHIFLFSVISLVMAWAYTFILERVISFISVFNRYIEYAKGRTFSLPFFVTSIVYTFIYIYYSFALVDSDRLDENDRKRVNLIIISIIFSILSLRYIVILRLSYLALLQLVVLVPKVEKSIFDGKLTLRIIKSLIVAVAFFMITSLVAGNNRYYGYSTIYNDKPRMEWYR